MTDVDRTGVITTPHPLDTTEDDRLGMVNVNIVVETAPALVVPLTSA